MALNIPNVGTPLDALLKGISTGSGAYSNAMQPILDREKQAQAERHFQEQLKLSKAASGRNTELFKYRLQELQDKHAAAQFERNMMNQLLGMGGGDMQGGGQAGGMGAPAPQQMPTQEQGQGMGMFTPEGLQQAQQAPPQQMPQGQGQGGQNPLMNSLMQNPMMRGWFKHKFGYDPLAPVAQTPEQKQASQLDLFKQKEAVKQANKATSGGVLTDKIKSKYQNVVGGAASAKPILRKLIAQVKKGEIPGQAVGALFKRDAQANYKGEISTLLDGIRNAYTIPNTDSGTQKAEDKVLRKSGESDANYANRLGEILKQIEFREKDATTKLNAGNINAGQTVHLVGPNGEDYDVPEDEVDQILADNPGVKRG